MKEMLNGFESRASCFKKKSKTDILGLHVSSDVKHIYAQRVRLEVARRASSKGARPA